MSLSDFIRESSSYNLSQLPEYDLPTVIAMYDVQNSGVASGMWFKNLEKSVAIAQGLFIKEHMSEFIGFCEALIAIGAINSELAVPLNGSDRLGYCVDNLDYFELFVKNQNTQFVYRLSPVQQLADRTFFTYSARSISEKSFYSGKAPCFKYDDMRDDGYAGTVDRVFNWVDNGFYYAREIQHAFNSIQGAQIDLPQ